MQTVLRIDELPEVPLDASHHFQVNHLDEALVELERSADHLVVILPSSASDHDDWRRTLARDLARKFTPKRAVVLGGGSDDAQAKMLAFLDNAPGVTGQYLPLHD